MSGVPICERLRAIERASPDFLGVNDGGCHTCFHRNPDGPEAADTIEALVSHISEQIEHVETRIQDGKKMGATVWRIALEDIARENRALLAKVTP